MEISETPDSIKPYYIMPEDMYFAIFVMKLKDGTTFRQYEYDQKANRWIAHHWNEVPFEDVIRFEVWAFYFDQYTEPRQYPIFKINLRPWMTPVFKYKAIQVMDGSPVRRTVIFGVETDHGNILWEADNGYNIKSIDNGNGDDNK